jgi:hypothetical protein
MSDRREPSAGERNLAERYVEAVLQRGACSERGDYKTGNKAFDRMTKIRHDIWKLPDRGVSLLSNLLDHPSDWVRLSASTPLLQLQKDTACSVLENLAARVSRDVANEAEMVL